MTHTPASGRPFAPVTTPVMSSPSVTGDGAMLGCWVWHPAAAAIATADTILLSFIVPPSRNAAIVLRGDARWTRGFASGSEPDLVFAYAKTRSGSDPGFQLGVCK